MKIIHVIFSLNTGGAEGMLYRLLRAQLSNKDQEHIICCLSNIGNLGENLISQGFKVRSLNCFSPLSYFYNFFLLRKIFIEEKPKIVHTWMYNANLYGGLAAFSVGIKNIVWSIRANHIANKLFNPTKVINYICSLLSYVIPKKILYVGNVSKTTHIKQGYSKSKNIIIPNGYDIKSFERSKPKIRKIREKIRNELNIKSNEKIILSIARFHKIKDHGNFIECCKILSKNYKNLKFLLVGKGVNECVEVIKKIFDNSRFLENFILVDHTENVIPYYYASDIFCLHSASEAFPNALAEAMLSGMPCVATAVGEVPDMLKMEELIVDIKSPRLLAESIMFLLQKTEIEKSKIGCQNIKYMTLNYDIKKISSMYTHLYKSLN